MHILQAFLHHRCIHTCWWTSCPSIYYIVSKQPVSSHLHVACMLPAAVVHISCCAEPSCLFNITSDGVACRHEKPSSHQALFMTQQKLLRVLALTLCAEQNMTQRHLAHCPHLVCRTLPKGSLLNVPTSAHARALRGYMGCTWLGNSEDSDSDNSDSDTGSDDPSANSDIRIVAYILPKAKDGSSGDIIVYFNCNALPILVRAPSKHLLGEALVHSLATSFDCWHRKPHPPSNPCRDQSW